MKLTKTLDLLARPRGFEPLISGRLVNFSKISELHIIEYTVNESKFKFISNVYLKR